MSETFDLKEHLQTMAAIFAVIGTILAGMTASMMILVYDGLIVATRDEGFGGGRDFGDYFGDILPVIILTFLLIEGLFVWGYFRYAGRVRKDPSQRFEF